MITVQLIAVTLLVNGCLSQSESSKNPSSQKLKDVWVGAKFGINLQGPFKIATTGKLPPNVGFYSAAPANFLYGIPQIAGRYAINVVITQMSNNASFPFMYILNVRGVELASTNLTSATVG